MHGAAGCVSFSLAVPQVCKAHPDWLSSYTAIDWLKYHKLFTRMYVLIANWHSW